MRVLINNDYHSGKCDENSDSAESTEYYVISIGDFRNYTVITYAVDGYYLQFDTITTDSVYFDGFVVPEGQGDFNDSKFAPNVRR